MATGWINRADASRIITQRIRTSARRLRPIFERRDSSRVKVTVACNLGSVQDLSTGGMRIRTRRRLKGTVQLELWTPSRRLELQGEVKWTKRLGFRRYMNGLAFGNITPEVAAQLTQFAAG